jgi:hypothetical protein
MIIILIIYWIATTIYGVYWLIKHPSERHGDDMEEFTLFEVLGKIFPSALLAWMFVPIGLLSQIKFKRKYKTSEAGKVFADQADMTITFKRNKHE